MTDLPAPVRASLDAVDALDTDIWVATFTPDGYVDDWGRTFAGPEALREWSNAEFIGKNVTLDVISVTDEGDEVVVVATVGGDGFNGPSTFTFTVDDDLVSSMTITA